MSTHNKCFHGEIKKKISILLNWKSSLSRFIFIIGRKKTITVLWLLLLSRTTWQAKRRPTWPFITHLITRQVWVNWPSGSREEVQYKFSRWQPSWISYQNDFSYFWSASHLHTSNEVSSQLPFWFRICLCWGFTAQSTQWGHVEHGQFTWPHFYWAGFVF